MPKQTLTRTLTTWNDHLFRIHTLVPLLLHYLVSFPSRSTEPLPGQEFNFYQFYFLYFAINSFHPFTHCRTLLRSPPLTIWWLPRMQKTGRRKWYGWRRRNIYVYVKLPLILFCLSLWKQRIMVLYFPFFFRCSRYSISTFINTFSTLFYSIFFISWTHLPEAGIYIKMLDIIDRMRK